MTDPFDQPQLDALIQRTFASLDIYRSDIVLIGGLVPLLYRHLPGFQSPGLEPCGTMDLDLAVDTHVPIKNNVPIAGALKQDGFKEITIPGMDHRHQTQYFQLSDGPQLAEDHLEFLAPLRGPDRQRPLHPQAGLTAQALRFIELLRARPVTCPVPSIGDILVPHPLTYAIQKTRIREDRRKTGKHRKDQADVVYVIWAFASEWTHWQSMLAELIAENDEWAAWIRTTLQLWNKLYLAATGPGPGEVVNAFTHAGIPIDEATVRTVMTDFLAIITGS